MILDAGQERIDSRLAKQDKQTRAKHHFVYHAAEIMSQPEIP
jgi:hypothetical protein